nr:hypothetical protein [Tanacetum cinerariifolium]
MERNDVSNPESWPRNQDSLRTTVQVEDTSSKAMVVIDGAVFDWSYMADDKVPTNMALMDFSDLEDVTEAENPIEHEDETVPASVHEVGESSTAAIPKKDVRFSVEQGTAAMEKLVEKLGYAEDKAECKKLKKELKEARLSNTFLRMKNERENVDAAIAAKRARQANVINDVSRSGPVRRQDITPAVHECTFAGFMKCNPTVFYRTERAVELQRWFEKTESVFGISECVKGKKVKFIF